MDIHKFIIFSDLQLVVNQCYGQFKVWELNCVRYREKKNSLLNRKNQRQIKLVRVSPND